MNVRLALLAAAGATAVGAPSCGDANSFGVAVTIDRGALSMPSSLRIDATSLSAGGILAQSTVLASESALSPDAAETYSAVIVPPAGADTVRIDVAAFDSRGNTMAIATVEVSRADRVVNRTLALEATTTCGDGVAQPGEECDGADLAGAACDLLETDFFGGTLACRPDCAFDTTGCTAAPLCGDGVADEGEDCDGADLAGRECSDRGYVSGTLACSDACAYDESACAPQPNCGDGAAAFTEQCDGEDLKGRDCVSLGCAAGTLACTTTCVYDLGACTGC